MGQMTSSVGIIKFMFITGERKMTSLELDQFSYDYKILKQKLKNMARVVLM